MTVAPLPLVDTPSVLLVGVPAFCECLAEIVEDRWSGTAAELLERLCEVATQRALDITTDEFWPHEPAAVSAACSNYVDLLEQLGIYRKRGSGYVLGGGAAATPAAGSTGGPPEPSDRRITFLRDALQAGQRAPGSGSLSQVGEVWYGVWRVGGKVLTRRLGHCDSMSRTEALAVMDRGIPEPQRRPPGSGTVWERRGRWYVRWQRGEIAVNRTLGTVTELTVGEVDALVEAGPDALPPKRRPNGAGLLRQRAGSWHGQWRVAGVTSTRIFGRVDDMTREEAEERLAAAIAASKSREPSTWSPFDAIRRVAAE